MRRMTWKKKLIGYPFWFVTVLFGLLGLYLLGDSFDHVFHCERILAILPYVGLCLLSGGLTLLIWKAFPKVSLQDFEKRHRKGFAVIAIALVGVGIFLRQQLVESAEQTNAYIEAAAIFRGSSVPSCNGGAEYLYTWFLHKLFFFFGNQPIVAIHAQLIVQVLALCLLCFGIFHLWGRTAGVLSLAITMLPPGICQMSVAFSPENVYFFLWALAFFVITRKEVWELRVIWYIESILIISIVCAVDGAGFLLLPLFLAVICASEEERAPKSLLTELLIGFFGVAGGFLIGCLFRASASSMTLGEFLGEYWNVMGQAEGPNLWTPTNPWDWAAGAVVVFGILLGVFGYFRNKEREALLFAAILCLCYAVVSCLGGFSPAVSGVLIPAALSLNLFGAGILTGLCKVEGTGKQPQKNGMSAVEQEEQSAPEQKKPEEALQRLSQQKDINADRDASAKEVAESSGERQPLTQTKVGADTSDEGLAELDLTDEKTKQASDAVVEPEPEQSKPEEAEVKFPDVELLESPLPLPKKHVKKAVDFAIDTPDDDDYDYPVADDADYDV